MDEDRKNMNMDNIQQIHSTTSQSYADHRNNTISGGLGEETNCQMLLRAYRDFQKKMRDFRHKTGSDRKMAALNNDVTSCASNGLQLVNVYITILIIVFYV